METKTYRLGKEYKLCIYENDRLMCQCTTAQDANLVLEALQNLQHLFLDQKDKVLSTGPGAGPAAADVRKKF